MLYCDCYVAILETSPLVQKIAQARFKILSTKSFNKSYIYIYIYIYIYKDDLTLNNQQWLICHKT